MSDPRDCLGTVLCQTWAHDEYILNAGVMWEDLLLAAWSRKESRERQGRVRKGRERKGREGKTLSWQARKLLGRMQILIIDGGPEGTAMFKGAASSVEIPPNLQGCCSSEQSTAETCSPSSSSESSGLGYGCHSRTGASQGGCERMGEAAPAGY